MDLGHRGEKPEHGQSAQGGVHEDIIHAELCGEKT